MLAFFYVKLLSKYLCIRIRSSKNMSMPNEMQEAFNEVHLTVAKVEMLYKTAKERQEMWEKLIHEQRESDKEKLSLIERRWNSLMKTVIVLAGIFLISFIRDTIALGQRPTAEQITQEINQGDYATKSDAMRGTESVIESVYHTFDKHTDIADDELYTDKENAKVDANRKITNYNPREIK